MKITSAVKCRKCGRIGTVKIYAFPGDWLIWVRLICSICHRKTGLHTCYATAIDEWHRDLDYQERITANVVDHVKGLLPDAQPT